MKGKATIVTGYDHVGYVKYGHRLVNGLWKLNNYYSPVAYMTLYDPTNPAYKLLNKSRMEVRDQADIPGFEEFLERHGRDPRVMGKKDNGRWNEKEKKAGYSYRYDMYKFFRMILVMWNAAHIANKLGEKAMIWLDGDNVVRKDLPDDLVERSMPDGYDYAYLGRHPKHSETGYLVFRLPEALPILDTWADYCLKDTFMAFKEWHSAYLFDRACEEHPDIKGFNLTPGGRGHVIHKCWVGEYFDHCKGNRKKTGRSPEAR